MTAIKVEKFGGMLPAWGDRLLPDGQAASAENAYLFSGELIGWRQPKLLRALVNSAAKFVFRVPTISKTAASSYLVFQSQPNAGDTVTVGDDTYTFTATVINDFDVLIGATATDTASNFLAALTVDFGAKTNQGTLYGNGCAANGAVDQRVGYCVTDVSGFGPYVKAVAPDFGAAYNNTRTLESTSGARTIWLYDLNSLSNTTTTLMGGTNPSFDSELNSASTWLEFVDPDTTVLRSLTVDDRFQRYYFASPSLPPKYNTYDRIVAGDDPWLLGVPAPGCSPGVYVTGGGNEVSLGDSTTNLASGHPVGANTLILRKVTPEGNMQVNDISFVPFATDTDVVYVGAVYLDDGTGNAPGDLLAVGQYVNTGITAGTTAVSAFVNPIGLLADTDYWIGIAVDKDIQVTAGDGNSTSVEVSNTFTNGPPAVVGSYTAGKPNLQLWVNLLTEDVIESRAYVYTWVTEYAEEGPPSPPTVTDGWSNGVWRITLFTPPPDEVGVIRNLKKVNIYRTVPGTTGDTVYFFVTSVDIGTTEYVDLDDDATVALNSQMESTNWFPPPEGLEAIVEMPNGIAVGYKGNELWFCEPYRPHAWPPGYVLTTEFPIINIGVTGNAVIAVTAAKPYVAQGVHPATMTLTKGQDSSPCSSRRSLVSSDQGVYYVSKGGLVLVTESGQVKDVTEDWITNEKWDQLVPAKNITAVKFLTSYFAFGSTNGVDNSVAQQGFTIEMKHDSQSFSIWPHPGGHRMGFCKLTSFNDVDIDNIEIDPWSGQAIIVQNGGVYWFDFTDTAPTNIPYKWKTKKYQGKVKESYGAMKFFFDVPAGTPAQSATRAEYDTDSALWDTLAADQYGIVRVYADDVLVTVREIRKSGEPLRILDGFKADTWQFEVEARVLITNFQVASTMKELSRV